MDYQALGFKLHLLSFTLKIHFFVYVQDYQFSVFFISKKKVIRSNNNISAITKSLNTVKILSLLSDRYMSECNIYHFTHKINEPK